VSPDGGSWGDGKMMENCLVCRYEPRKVVQRQPLSHMPGGPMKGGMSLEGRCGGQGRRRGEGWEGMGWWDRNPPNPAPAMGKSAAKFKRKPPMLSQSLQVNHPTPFLPTQPTSFFWIPSLGAMSNMTSHKEWIIIPVP
jgi:hypothetical protein